MESDTIWTITKEEQDAVEEAMKSPEVIAMIDRINELGDEIRELKEKCRRLTEQNKKKNGTEREN